MVQGEPCTALHRQPQHHLQHQQAGGPEPHRQRLLPQAARTGLADTDRRPGIGNRQPCVRHQPLLLLAEHVAYTRPQRVLYPQLCAVQHLQRAGQQLHGPQCPRLPHPGERRLQTHLEGEAHRPGGRQERRLDDGTHRARELQPGTGLPGHGDDDHPRCQSLPLYRP